MKRMQFGCHSSTLSFSRIQNPFIPPLNGVTVAASLSRRFHANFESEFANTVRAVSLWMRYIPKSNDATSTLRRSTHCRLHEHTSDATTATLPYN